MKLGFEPQNYWCGTEASYDYVLECSAKAAEALAFDGEMPAMWDKVGSTAVVNIQGPLVQGDAGFMRLFGITGYDNIREAVAAAIADEAVKSIMLNIDSGGGQVAGVSDTAKFLLEAGKKKPITTYSDGQMASAAYWLGSTGSHLTISDTTEAGSIGVLVMHAERSAQLAQDGVKVTVVRAGKYKASTNSVEPLSDIGRASLENQVNHLYTPFLEHSASMRGMTPEVADQKIAQGKVFIGSQGLDVGLVDKVGTYEEALAIAASTGLKSKSAKVNGSISFNGVNAENVTYNPAQMTKGNEMKPTLHIPTAADMSAGSGEDAAAIAAAAEAAATLEAEATAQAAEAAAQAAEAAKATAAIEENKVIAFLRNELKESQGALIAAEATAAKATAEVNVMKDTHTKFEAIVRLSVDVMAVSLGGTGGTTLAGEALLAEHARIEPTYVKKFKAGGVAATAPGTVDKVSNKQTANPLFAARVRQSKAN
jgi:signal peptide peptidase SppA